MSKFFSFLLLCLWSAFYAQTCPTLKDKNGTEDNILIDCGYLSSNSCFNLYADFPTIKNSSDYTVSPTAYALKAPSAASIPVKMYRDNVYIKKLSFSDAVFGGKDFKFHLYGKPYTSLSISSNGYITLNPDTYNSPMDFPLSVPPLGSSINDAKLPNLSIFGVYEDLDNSLSSSAGSEVYYEVEGKAPCRILRITFYKNLIKGSSQFVTSQIALHESFGTIDVFVENRDAGSADKDAIIGITNEKQTGIAAPGRDIGNWSAKNEGWRFEPSGADMAPQLSWYLDDKQIAGASGSTLQVCPENKSQVYKVNGLYNLGADTFDISKEITVAFADTYPLAKNYSEFFCSGAQTDVYQSDFYSKISVNPVANFVFKYYLTEAEARAGGQALDPAVALSKNTNYYVRIENKDDSTCFRIAKLTFDDLRGITYTKDVYVCDTNNDGIEKGFTLKNLDCQIFINGVAYTASKYYVGTSSTLATNADLTDGTQLYAEIGTSCGAQKLGPITVHFTPAPSVNTFTKVQDFYLCDYVNDITNSTEEPIDWLKYFTDHNLVVSSDPNATAPVFYLTYADAYLQQNPLKVIYEGDPDKNYTYDIYARVDYVSSNKCRGNCFSIATIPIKVVFTKIILNVKDADEDSTPDSITTFDEETADIYLCKGDSKDVNLETDAKKLITVTNPIGAAGVTITYHDSWQSAKDLTSTGISVNQTLPANSTQTEYYIRYSLGTTANACYVVKPLVYNIVSFNPTQAFDICYNKNITTDITLSDYYQAILGKQATERPQPVITFYADQAQSQMITAITLKTTPITVYARINSGLNTNCWEIYPITFTPKEKPELKQNLVTVDIDCDNNYDGEEYYDVTSVESQIIDNTSGDYTIEYFLNYDSGTGTYSNQISESDLKHYRFTTKEDGQTFYVRVSQKGTVCISNARILFNVKFRNTPIILNDNIAVLKCYVYNQYIYKFDLNLAAKKVYSNQNPPYADLIASVEFYETLKGAENQTNKLPTDYPLQGSITSKDLYARFDSKQGCFSIKKFELSIIQNLNFRNSSYTVPICDNSFGNNFTFDLSKWLADRLAETYKGYNTSLLENVYTTIHSDYTFHRAAGDNSPLTGNDLVNFHPNPNTQTSVWVKASVDNCAAWSEIKFDFGDLSVPEFNYADYCGNEKIDLTVFENQSVFQPAASFEYYRSKNDLVSYKNAITNPSQYPFENIRDIYVRANKSNGSCAKQAIIHLPLPKLVPTLEHNQINNGRPYDFCPGSSVTISPDFNSFFPNTTITKYEWKDPSGNVISTTSSATISTEGKFSVTLTTSYGCVGTSTFDVVKREVPVVVNITGSNRMLTVTATGSKTILYAASYKVNGVDVMTPWQTSNIFKDLPEGVIVFYLKFEDETDEACIVTEDSMIPVIKNVVTPNSDGKNDTWVLDDLYVFNGQMVKVRIIDRFGAVIFEKESTEKIVWDGYAANKRELPTTSYWYIIQLPDGRNYSGWILLKNRN